MARLNGIYTCQICGNMVEVVLEGKGELVCCGQPMELLEENKIDASLEKHIPISHTVGDIVMVQVGSTAHPMQEEHYIEWIEIMVGGKIYRRSLKPGMEPQTEFCIPNPGQKVVLRAYCNLHGLWRG